MVQSKHGIGELVKVKIFPQSYLFLNKNSHYYSKSLLEKHYFDYKIVGYVETNDYFMDTPKRITISWPKDKTDLQDPTHHTTIQHTVPGLIIKQQRCYNQLFNLSSHVDLYKVYLMSIPGHIQFLWFLDRDIL